MSNLLIWVAVVALAAVVVGPLARTAWRLLRGEDEMVAGGSWGRQLLTRRARPRKPGPGA